MRSTYTGLADRSLSRSLPGDCRHPNPANWDLSQRASVNLVGKRGIEPQPLGPKPSALPLRYIPEPEWGIEPQTSTLRRVRSAIGAIPASRTRGTTRVIR